MTRLGRARGLANAGTHVDGDSRPCVKSYWRSDAAKWLRNEGSEVFASMCEANRIAASLALDGYPAPPTRRKIPACTPVFKKGMPF